MTINPVDQPCRKAQPAGVRRMAGPARLKQIGTPVLRGDNLESN